MGLKDLFSRKKGDEDAAEDADDDEFGDEDEDDAFAAEDFEAEPMDGDVDEDDEEEAEPWRDDDPPNFGDDDDDDAADDDEFGDEDLDDEDLDDDDFDDDDDYEEGLFDNPFVLYSVLGAVFLVIVSVVGVGAWFFLSSGAEEIIADSQQQEIVQDESSSPSPPPSNGENQQSAAETNTGTSLNQLADGDDLPEEATVSAAATTSQGGESQAAATDSLNAIATAGGLNALAGSGLNSLASGSGTGGGLIVPASIMAGFDGFLDYPSPSPLPRAPDRDFLQDRGEGLLPLPKIAADGREPWEFYARPLVPESDTKRVALVVTGMGLSTAETLAAIRKLPPQVTLSFSPYADDLEQWLLRSRRVGHEVLLGLPLESDKFPIEDPGPLSLRTDFDAAENLSRLEEIMELFQGYIGFEVLMGSKFTARELPVRNLLEILNDRGLLILEGEWNDRSAVPRVGAEIGVPRVFSNVRLDDVEARAAIDARLKELDNFIATHNQAVATTGMSPAAMGRIKAWLQTLPGRGIELVPLSSLVDDSSTEGVEQ